MKCKWFTWKRLLPNLRDYTRITYRDSGNNRSSESWIELSASGYEAALDRVKQKKAMTTEANGIYLWHIHTTHVSALRRHIFHPNYPETVNPQHFWRNDKNWRKDKDVRENK
jgi:hypothetical protein